MPLIRRRPLLRAAMVGGAAYATGKHAQRGQQREYEQDQAIADMQGQQYAAPPPAAAPAPAAQSPVDKVTALTQLKSLLDAGVLTQEEFDSQKHQILGEA